MPGGNLVSAKEKSEEGMALAVASTSYPLLNIFWTMLEFFLWVVWI